MYTHDHTTNSSKFNEFNLITNFSKETNISWKL